MPISIQLTFLRRTAAGPALLTVQDAKLGARTSTIHVTLSQEETSSKSKSSGGDKKKKHHSVKVAGYITVSDPVSEVGLSAPSDWTVCPPPPSWRPPEFTTTSPTTAAADGNNTPWVRIHQRYPKLRRAVNHTEVFGPAGNTARQRRGIIDQWARFRPLGPKGGEGKWTDEAVAYLIDLFPLALQGFEDAAAAAAEASSGGNTGNDTTTGPFWFPTVTLNIDFKKRLPRTTGVEWLYSRVTTKSIHNGRTDIDVVVLDERGEVVALATQVGLVLSASRNLRGRELPYKIEEIQARGQGEGTAKAKI